MSRFTLFENGRVFLPRSHFLLDEFISEFVSFPTARHDDLLDATGIALGLAVDMGGVEPLVGKPMIW